MQALGVESHGAEEPVCGVCLRVMAHQCNKLHQLKRPGRPCGLEVLPVAGGGGVKANRQLSSGVRREKG